MKDLFNKDLSFIKDKKLFLFDMDGTIYNDNNLFEYTIPLLKELKKQHKHYMFVTNNSSKSVVAYINKLKLLGIETSKEDFFTSTMATSLYLRTHYKNKLVYAMGTKSFIYELINDGINVTTRFNKHASIVVTGFDTELTFKKLNNTVRMLTLNKDIDYIATNPDLFCPCSGGNLIDNGSIAQAIKNACNRYPKFIGKPAEDMILLACLSKNIDVEDSIVIGDRLRTDIQSAINANCDSILVLTGESTLRQARNFKSKDQIVVLNSIKELYDCLLDN